MGTINPRPNGGHMPEPQGPTRGLARSDASFSPGYDTSKSRAGKSMADLRRGYCADGSIAADSKSDGMEPA